MLKRSTKTISLLMIAASIVSMVPAFATDYETYEPEDGTVYSASAKMKGQIIIDGEINGDDDEAVYYYADGKYTKLDDAQPGDTIGNIFQDKYLQMTDSNEDSYYIDITTGKETDEYDNDVQEKEIARKVRNSIKNDNDGRFTKASYTDNLVAADTSIKSDGTTNIFGMTGKWRQFLYSLDNPFEAGDYSKDKSVILADEDGNYVDADYNLGKIGVYTTTGASVTIRNTKDTYEEKGDDGKTYEFKAQIKGSDSSNMNIKPQDEEADTITRTAELSIWEREKNSGEDYTNITDSVELGSSSAHYSQTVEGEGDNKYITVIQTISKAQSSDSIDGIKYAKDVNTYFITDKNGNAQPLLALGNGSDDIYTNMNGVRLITGGTYGNLVSYFYDAGNEEAYAEGITLKSVDGGYNYTDVGSYDDTDAETWAIGSGNVDVLTDGYIEEFNPTEDKFEKIYRVDNGMTDLSIDSKNNIIVWNQNKEIYTIISKPELIGAPADETKPIDSTTTTAAAVDATISKKNGWIQNLDKSWSYLNSDGIMVTGWINDNGNWYYCDASGVMLNDTTVDGYVLGGDGAWIN